MNSYPDCYLIGLPKAGTTALYNILTQSPQVFNCSTKEPNFFLPESVVSKGVRDLYSYSNLYREAVSKGLLAIDASVSYGHSPAALRSILTVKPDAKFILMVRRPERLVVSQFQQMRFGLYEEFDTFHSAWQDRLDNGAPSTGAYSFARDYPRSGCVGSIFHNILEVVPRDSIHVVVYEEFFTDQSLVLLGLLEFLNLRPFEYSSAHVNSAKVPVFSSLHRQIIHQGPLFRVLRLLVRSLPIISPAELKRIYDNNFVKAPAPIVNKDTQLYLEKYFEEEKRRFERLLGRAVTSWWS